MTTREVFVGYFDLLKETLMDKPAQIYNCDESEMPLDHKTVAQRGTKKFGSDHRVTIHKSLYLLVEMR